MTTCTGMFGRQCSCGMFHGDGGRMVDTYQHEAPRARPRFAPGVIEGPEADSDFLQKRGALHGIATVFWFLLFLASVGGFCAAVAYTAGSLLRSHGFI